jgi:BirA family biotin operon repressor/biotin-[acetyl-CoA-carboxylase] ligase
VLLRPLGSRPLLPLAVPLAVCEACEAVAPVRCAVKWPNDVWVEGRKLAGVLIEGRPEEDWAVIGVGVNVAVPAEAFPPELQDTATSLGTGPPPSVADALAAVNGALESWLERSDEEVLDGFRARDALRGRRIGWEGGEGAAAGIDDAGHLLVEQDDGTIALGAGEVHLDLTGPDP